MGRRRASSTVANFFFAFTPTSESGLRGYVHITGDRGFALTAAYASDRGNFHRVWKVRIGRLPTLWLCMIAISRFSLTTFFRSPVVGLLLFKEIAKNNEKKRYTDDHLR